jgi:hypothetical protein
MVQRRWMLGSLWILGACSSTGCAALSREISPLRPFSGAIERAKIRVTHDSFDVSHPRQRATVKTARGVAAERFDIEADFGKRVALEQNYDVASVGQEFDVRITSRSTGSANGKGNYTRATGRLVYSTLDRWEMERRDPEGRGQLEESGGVQASLVLEATTMTFGYPDAEIEIWLGSLHREYMVLSEGRSVLFATVSYSYYAFGKREFELIIAADIPPVLRQRALQAFLIAKVIVGD